MWRGKWLGRSSSASLYVVIGGGSIQASVARDGWPPSDGDPVGGKHLLPISCDAAAPVVTDLIACLDSLRVRLDGAGWRTKRIHVLVADAWLAAAVVPWREGSSAAQREASARAQLNDLGFEVALNDTVRVDDAPYGQPRLVVAYPAPIMAALNELARALGATLDSVCLLSMAALHILGRHAPDAWAVMDDQWMSLIQSNPHRNMVGLTVRRLAGCGASEEGREAQLLSHWQRLCLREPVGKGLGRLPVIDLAGAGNELAPTKLDPAWSALSLPNQAVDERHLGLWLCWRTARWRSALHAVSPIAPWSMASLLVGAVVLTAVGTLTLSVWSSVGDLRQLEAEQPLRTNTEPRPASSGWSRQEFARVQAVNQAVRALNLPVTRLLVGLVPPKDIRVFVSSVNAQAASAESLAVVKVQAQAESSADMTRYIAFVSGRRPYVDAYLTQHEVIESEPSRPLRFTMEARWEQ